MIFSYFTVYSLIMTTKMSLSQVLSDLLPFHEWDFMSIVYGIIASAIFLVITKWLGLFSKARTLLRNRKALINYKKSLQEECNTLIVVGKRKGFSLSEVYVSLDIAQSDLMTYKDEIKRPPRSYILVGGPGAGKSTTAKNLIFKYLEKEKRHTQPFFIKLKDYSGTESIEDYLENKLSSSGFTDSPERVKKYLSNSSAFCILDGLDEVRPNLRKKICAEINRFYSDFFKVSGSLIVTCRKEAYRDIPLDIPSIWEVRPLSDEQINRFAEKWPLEYPVGKTKDTFFRDLASTPRILELARSPLLLVGGLMHYTETNLGIPEQRFEYLRTMSKWLISDWATAQGHAPDKYRNVYNRLLARLAYYMHKNQLSEIPINKTLTFMSTLLPSYGYQLEEAETVLNSLTVKTGILIKDGNSLFFAQFGMQEYFVSTELSNQIDLSQIHRLNPLAWWRESILLRIAQEQEPTQVLNALFLKEPILAVAAVAECPTPSIDIQKKAISVCLELIDKKKEAIKGSLIPLLRKIRDELEIYLCGELEKRLTLDSQISALVGLSLATAGTPTATKTLARHPEIWNVCLSQTGFLSSSFENLLIDWIKDGDDYHGMKAADLISTRLSYDRMLQLIQIIPTLGKKKKDHLSRLILKDIASEPVGLMNYNDPWLEIVSQLVPNVKDSKSFIKELRKNKEPNTKFSRLPQIIVAFFFRIRGEKCSDQEILDIFYLSTSWAKNRRSIFYWALSGAVLLLYQFEISQMTLTFTVFILLTPFITLLILPLRSNFLLGVGYYPRLENFFLVILIFFILGGFDSLGIASLFKLIFFEGVFEMCLLANAIVFSLLGFIFWKKTGTRKFHVVNLRDYRKISIILCRPVMISSIYFIWIIVFSTISLLTEKKILLDTLNFTISSIYLFWILIVLMIYLAHWNYFKIAEKEAQHDLKLRLDNFFPDYFERVYNRFP